MEHSTYRFAVRSLELANYLTTQRQMEIKSVRDGRGDYKVFYFDNTEEVRRAADDWIKLKERGELDGQKQKGVFKGYNRRRF